MCIQHQHNGAMSSILLELSNLIANSVTTLNKACAESGTPFPGLDAAFSPSSEAFRGNPEAAEAANTIAAAATQIAFMVLPPPAAMFSLVSGVSICLCSEYAMPKKRQHFKSAALRVCLEANVTEILREGGPKVSCSV